MGVSAGRQTTIEANPQPIAMDTAETAVIVVDMQNGFCSKGGLFDRSGINISAVRKTVGPTRRVLSAAREAGIRIV
jgi:Amidases related to nicotinamidase